MHGNLFENAFCVAIDSASRGFGQSERNDVLPLDKLAFSWSQRCLTDKQDLGVDLTNNKRGKSQEFSTVTLPVSVVMGTWWTMWL